MSTDNISEMIKATIQAKVIEAFNTAPEVVEKLVACALNQKVNSYGGKPDSFHRDTMPYMDWLVGDEIRKAVSECVREYVAMHNETIKEKVRYSIATADIGGTIAEKVTEVMGQDYNWTINFDLKGNKQ